MKRLFRTQGIVFKCNYRSGNRVKPFKPMFPRMCFHSLISPIKLKAIFSENCQNRLILCTICYFHFNKRTKHVGVVFGSNVQHFLVHILQCIVKVKGLSLFPTKSWKIIYIAKWIDFHDLESGFISIRPLSVNHQNILFEKTSCLVFSPYESYKWIVFRLGDNNNLILTSRLYLNLEPWHTFINCFLAN